MKRLITCLLIILSISWINVFADDYQVNTLIPVDSVATVNTEKFSYIDFIYHSQVDEKGNAKIDFASIKNNTHSKTAVSINILLFDANKENIGFLTYCSDKDLSSNNYGFKLGDNEAKPFDISVVKKYFADSKKAEDVKFIAVMDENKYCQIGGYDKYAGSTIEKIISGEAVANKNKNNIFDIDIVSLVSNNKKIIHISLYVLGIFVLLMIFGGILNKLYRKMFNRTSSLVYIPIVNFYICLKLAFGDLIALIVIILFLISLGLLAIHISFLIIIISVIILLSFIVVIIKLITKKYELFYLGLTLDPSTLKKKKKDQEEGINQEEVGKPLDLSYKDKKVDETPVQDDSPLSNLYQGNNTNDNEIETKVVDNNITSPNITTNPMQNENMPLSDININPFGVNNNDVMDDDDDDDLLYNSINEDDGDLDDDDLEDE